MAGKRSGNGDGGETEKDEVPKKKTPITVKTGFKDEKQERVLTSESNGAMPSTAPSGPSFAVQNGFKGRRQTSSRSSFDGNEKNERIDGRKNHRNVVVSPAGSRSSSPDASAVVPEARDVYLPDDTVQAIPYVPDRYIKERKEETLDRETMEKNYRERIAHVEAFLEERAKRFEPDNRTLKFGYNIKVTRSEEMEADESGIAVVSPADTRSSTYDAPAPVREVLDVGLPQKEDAILSDGGIQAIPYVPDRYIKERKEEILDPETMERNFRQRLANQKAMMEDRNSRYEPDNRTIRSDYIPGLIKAEVIGADESGVDVVRPAQKSSVKPARAPTVLSILAREMCSEMSPPRENQNEVNKTAIDK